MLNAVIAGLLLLAAGVLLIAGGLGYVRASVLPALGVAGLVLVVLLLAGLAFGLLSGGVTLFVAVATLAAAIGFFLAIWLEPPAPQAGHG